MVQNTNIRAAGKSKTSISARRLPCYMTDPSEEVSKYKQPPKLVDQGGHGHIWHYKYHITLKTGQMLHN